VAGRALVFSDPEIIRIVSERFVPVTGDDWYSRRRQDEAGEFFRRVASQRGDDWDGDSTRQGLYCFTSDGTLLAYRNNNDPRHVKDLLRRALERWQELDPSIRERREFTEDLGRLDPRYARQVPEGTVVVRVHARELERKDDGSMCKAEGRGVFQNLGSLDHLWIREDEVKRLLPPQGLKDGEPYPLDETIARRIVRFHLVDNTRGEPPMWSRDEIRKAEIRLSVAGRAEGKVELRLEGGVELRTGSDSRGYEARLEGTIAYDAEKESMTRFEVVALGEHWGRGHHTPRARPGRSLLGIAFTLADGTDAADEVPPQAARDLDGYFRAR